MGSTGISTGNHLHYEVIKNRKRINPLNFIYGTK
ncbi:M23 family metallopeptidase (plasmid) [Bacteroides salyersiae]|nr:M23 family metallopeptidase [Bacteroides salyersiae]